MRWTGVYGNTEEYYAVEGRHSRLPRTGDVVTAAVDSKSIYGVDNVFGIWAIMTMSTYEKRGRAPTTCLNASGSNTSQQGQRAFSPRAQENENVWGRQLTGPDRSFRSPLMTLPDLSRGPSRSFNSIGGEGYGGTSRSNSYSNGYSGRQDMNDTFSGGGARSGGGFCRGRC